MASTIESVLQEKRVFPPSPAFIKQANIPGMEAYRKLVAEAERDFEGFWARLARENLLWSKPFTKVLDEPIEAGQACTSFNRLRGTIRGLHVQVEPFPETKTLWCVAGAVWDVVVDLRATEPTYGSWAAVDLTAADLLHRPVVERVDAPLAEPDLAFGDAAGAF